MWGAAGRARGADPTRGRGALEVGRRGQPSPAQKKRPPAPSPCTPTGTLLSSSRFYVVLQHFNSLTLKILQNNEARISEVSIYILNTFFIPFYPKINVVFIAAITHFVCTPGAGFPGPLLHRSASLRSRLTSRCKLALPAAPPRPGACRRARLLHPSHPS